MTGTTLFRIDVSGAQNDFTIHSYKNDFTIHSNNQIIALQKGYILLSKRLFTESHVCPIMLFVHRFR